MQKLYTRQKEKGGIIDLEAEGKKFLVVTNSGNEGEEEKYTELSPTDYQLGCLNRFDFRNLRNNFVQMNKGSHVPKHPHLNPLKRRP